MTPIDKMTLVGAPHYGETDERVYKSKCGEREDVYRDMGSNVLCP